MIKNTTQLIEKINLTGCTAEEVLYSLNGEKPMKSVASDEPVNYKKYAEKGYTDRDISLQMQEHFNIPDDKMKKINDLLNNIADKFPEDNHVCPHCGNHTIAIGNDGCYCKFCGGRILAENSLTAESVGAQFKRIRQEKGLILREASERIDISISALSRFENGKKVLSINTILNIVDVYGVSVNTLFMTPTRGANIEKGPIAKKVEYNEEECFLGSWTEYKCPNCYNEIDLTIAEALSVDFDAFKRAKLSSSRNDGKYCKCCGQKIKRPVKIDTAKFKSEICEMMNDAVKALKSKKMY